MLKALKEQNNKIEGRANPHYKLIRRQHIRRQPIPLNKAMEMIKKDSLLNAEFSRQLKEIENQLEYITNRLIYDKMEGLLTDDDIQETKSELNKAIIALYGG